MTTVPYAISDVEYVCEHFAQLDELCVREDRVSAQVRDYIAFGLLPRPSYVLPDGREMVPHDYFALADEAGGTDGLRASFVRRLSTAAVEAGTGDDPEEEWQSYLTGLYGVCLKHVTPETIVRKSTLMARIEALLTHEDETDEIWRRQLREAVDALDELERSFAPHYDRLRFGSPSSRHRLITAVRRRFPDVFAPETAMESRSHP